MSVHRRNDSDELVVFEAKRYFSGGDENPSNHSSSAVFPHNLTGEGGGSAAAAGMSLDTAAIGSNNPHSIPKQCTTREKKKHKQPSSPGGRLASFLSSLFNQTNLMKKKKSKASSDDVGDHDRRRRTSIGHFGIAADCDPNSTFYDKASTKCLKSFSDDIAVDNGGFRNPRKEWTAAGDEDRRELGKHGDDDEGADSDSDSDSDSSSDLFDLPNMGYYSSGLSVYGTTNVGRIRVGAPISSSTTV